MAPIAVIQMGPPSQALQERLGGPEQWFATALGVAPARLLLVRPAQGEPLPEPDRFAVAIITGSRSMVTEHLDWSERTARWAKRMIDAQAPLLGICYGHQLMAYALGGRVGNLPGGRETGTVSITLNADGRRDPLFQALPATFAAHVSHTQAVLQPPAGARVLGSSAHDAHQILRYGPNAVSLQFHPEFTPAILATLMAMAEPAAEGLDPQRRALESTLADAPLARRVMLDFVHPHTTPPHTA